MKVRLSVIKELLPLIMIMGMAHSCVTEEFEVDKLNNAVQINPNVAAPLGYLTFRLDSMLNDSTKPDLLVINEDGTMTLRYRKQVFSDKLDFSFQEVDTNFSEMNPFPPSLDLTQLGKDTVVVYTYPIEIQLVQDPSLLIDSIWINSLNLTTFLNANPQVNGKLELTSTSIIGPADSLDFTIDFGDPKQTRTLDGYRILLRNNQLTLNAKMTIGRSETPYAGTQIFTLNFNVSDIDFRAIFGYLGEDELSLDPQYIDIGFFNSSLDGTFNFEHPELNIYFTNSIGIPLSVGMDDFFMTTKYNNKEVITYDDQPFTEINKDIRYPERNEISRNTSNDLVKYDTLLIDLNRTNIPDMLSDANRVPKTLTYTVRGAYNPTGTDSVNFITNDSQLSVDVELTLPLKGYTDYLILRDTLDFDFSTYYKKPPEEIKSLAFRVNLINGFPLEVDAKMDFVDEDFNRTTTLFDKGWTTVSSGMQKGSDCEIEPFINPPLNIDFPVEKIDSIAEAKNIIVYARISTPGFNESPPRIITLCNDHTFEAYIGVIVDAEVNSADYQ